MVEFAQVREEAIGKWPGIFSSFGIEVGTGKHQSCPSCGGKDRFRCDNVDGRGTYICNQCGAGDGFELLQKVLKIDYKEAYDQVAKVIGTVEASPHQPEKPVSPDVLREIFKNSVPVKLGDMVNRYLYYRGIDRNKIPNTLRYSEKVWEPETKQEQRAMLAVFTSSEGKAITMHRTYLNEHASKLNIESPKKILPPLEKMSGGAVRLYEHNEGILGIAEGIETAVAIHNHKNIPVWAALSAVLMEAWEPPKNAGIIRVFSDNDENFTGQKAAYNLANRLAVKENRRVEVYVPEKVGEDFLDEYCRETLLRQVKGE